MTRVATGHPTRAMSIVALMAGLPFMYRLPALQREYMTMTRQLGAIPATAELAADDLRPFADLPPAKPPRQLTQVTAPTTPTGRSGRISAPARAPLRLVADSPHTAATVPRWSGTPSAGGPVPPLPVAAARPGPGDLAADAYARLAAGDRRGAAGLFAAAIAAGPDPRQAQWQAEARGLHRRWSGDGYILFRQDGAGAPGPTASPVLGGGQLGANLAWTLDPLARRPVAVFARVNAAMPDRVDPDSVQAAVGVRWRPAPGVTLAAERLIAIGPAAIDDWSLRAAAGAGGVRGRVAWRGYAEADVIGNGDVYAGAQARIDRRIAHVGDGITIAAGGGGWGSVQITDRTVSRLDLGPGLRVDAPLGRVVIEVAADWRFRIVGNAAPRNGPVLTVSTGF